MKKECPRIPWDDYPKAVTNMEVGLNREKRNDSHLDNALDETDKRTITLNTSKIWKE